jgi:hypothetical protein
MKRKEGKKGRKVYFGSHFWRFQLRVGCSVAFGFMAKQPILVAACDKTIYLTARIQKRGRKRTIFQSMMSWTCCS